MKRTTEAAACIEDEARLIIYKPSVVLGSQLAFFGIIALLWMFFRPVVPAAVMHLWLALALILLALVSSFDLLFIFRRADDRRLLRFWHRVEKRQTMLFDAVAIGVIWLLLPFGNDMHRLICVAFCVGYVPMQMVSDPENVFGNRFSIVAVLGSFAIFLVSAAQTEDRTAFYALAVMVLVYGASLFAFADAFRSVVIDSLRSRRELDRANQALASALDEVSAERDARTRFISAAAHDLGQPLQAARLFAEQALMRQAIDEREAAMVRAVTALEAAQDMLGHMLQHLRLEADAVLPRIAPVELGKLLESIGERYRPQARASGTVIRIACNRCLLVTDAVLLDRAIGNLLQNALVHAGATRILLAARREQGGMAVYVRDNGIGIEPDDMAILFEDYRQGLRSAAPVRTGFGLGLGSVRRIAHLLGGGVSLVDRHRGAGFRLLIRAEAA